MNAMMILRGQRADYDGGRAAAAPDGRGTTSSPRSQRSARGAFPLAELPERHVLAEAFVHAAQAEGIPFTDDLNGESNEGVGFVPVSQRRGRRFSVVDGYLGPARRRPNLTIVTGRTRDADPPRDGRASASRTCSTADGHEEEAPAQRAVVLCAGAIGSPHLLAALGDRAARRPRGGRGRRRPRAARRRCNLVDHLANGLLVRTKGVETLASADSFAQPRALGASRERAAHVEPRRGSRLRPLAARPLRAGPRARARSRALRGRGAEAADGARADVSPSSSCGRGAPGRCTCDSADPRVLPAIDPRYLTDSEGEDEATLLRGLRLARRVLAQRAARRVRGRRDAPRPGRAHGRRAPSAPACAVADALPPGRHVSDGLRTQTRWSTRASGYGESPGSGSPTRPSCRRSRAATRTGRP